jgi:hypothetical protein
MVSYSFGEYYSLAQRYLLFSHNSCILKSIYFLQIDLFYEGACVLECNCRFLLLRNELLLQNFMHSDWGLLNELKFPLVNFTRSDWGLLASRIYELQLTIDACFLSVVSH